MQSKFLQTTPKSDFVYHCIPVTPHGDCIYPSDRYGMDISPDVRRQLNMPATEKTSLVFASPYITKALAFGLQGSLGEKIMNCGIEGSDNELVIACDRDAMLSRARDITVYKIAAKNFVDLPYADRQCVSTQAVPFKDTQVALRARNAQDLMRAGLQIISFTDAAKENVDYPSIQEAITRRGDKDIYSFVAACLRDGSMVWENQAAHINPDPHLAQKLGLVPALSSSARRPAAPGR